MNKILDEFDEDFWPQAYDILCDEGAGSFGRIDMVKNEIKTFIAKELTKQKSDIFSKICEHFDITLDDLPAFQDKDIIDLALIIGKMKYKNEILKCLPEKKVEMNNTNLYNLLTLLIIFVVNNS